ncbi:YetF domain-containing protein [Dyadobacter sp. CY312]|uniref:YetF domain-containing protein n=1 Tax=Dyadobacter sp. CY312 TaxID=2907303 RepID=UPI001F44CD16|nr:YetF domain-containing protein [Dyadobacter sp. CY312]MCE7043887.1 DUF421 domain-containing protein [Dyadobacter sp. CY312]
MEAIFEWERLLLNELPKMFLFEVIFRSAVMFTIVLVALRATGKRGVRQLSIFETVIIISLGSAAGDPMFYEDVGLVPALVVFATVIVLYRFVTWLTGKSKWFEKLIEGETVCLIKEGKFSLSGFKKESLAQDEFFSELRLKSVEHLGQVKNAYLEPNGALSVFFYEDSEVTPGLPILPQLYNAKSKVILKEGCYACSFCGHTENLKEGEATCPKCGHNTWLIALKTLRKA